MHTFRHWFLGRSLREQLLVAVLLVAGVVIWFASAAGRLRGTWNTHLALAGREREQSLLLASADDVRARVAAQLARIEPARSLNGTRLVAELQSLAGQANLKPRVDSGRSQAVDQFVAHTAEVEVRAAEFGMLMDLTDRIAARSPYLSLERITIVADPANPSRLDARLLVSAVEIPSK